MSVHGDDAKIFQFAPKHKAVFIFSTPLMMTDDIQYGGNALFFYIPPYSLSILRERKVRINRLSLSPLKFS